MAKNDVDFYGRTMWPGWAKAYRIIEAECERLAKGATIQYRTIKGFRRPVSCSPTQEHRDLVEILGSGDEELMKFHSLRIQTNQFFGLNR